jgi:hypothetical protein
MEEDARRHRHLVTRHRSPDRAQADGRAARRRAGRTSRSSSVASCPPRTRRCCWRPASPRSSTPVHALDDISALRRAGRRASTPAKEPPTDEQAASRKSLSADLHRGGAGPLGAGIRRRDRAARAAAQPLRRRDQAAVHAARLVGRRLLCRQPGLPGEFRRTPAASTPRCTGGAVGRSGSSSAWGCPRTTTAASRRCWRWARRRCR